uniref:T-cell surface glycoprotein CD3 zeta chain n=1 Tax=Cyclopterus lumpus TaxID=8103 RepID=A0A8C2ZFT2_CYCLU
MELQTRVSGLLVLVSVFPPAEAMTMYSPQLCYILDGFLGLYGLIITAMFIKEKFFRTKVKGAEEIVYSVTVLKMDGWMEYCCYYCYNNNMCFLVFQGLSGRPEGEYKELPVKREGLSAATRDTYDSLQMQPLPAR